MKKFLILLLCIISLYGMSQNKINPTYFYNYFYIDIDKVYINKIDSIRLNKNVPGGEVHIFTKNKQFSFLSINDLLRKYTNFKGPSIRPKIFKINNSIINDTTGIKIDNTFFVKVDVIDISAISYINDLYKDLVIIEITLSKDEIKPETYIKD